MPTEALPQYACAILEDPDGRLLLESRPADARHAANKLTCFGGRREAGESPEQCLRRELREELGWNPDRLVKSVTLIVEGEVLAWFYHGLLNIPREALCLEAGRQALLLSRSELQGAALSGWHRAALDAWMAGEASVEVQG